MPSNRRKMTVHHPIAGATPIADCPDANLSALGFFSRSGGDGTPSLKLQALPHLQRVPPSSCEDKMGSMPGRFCVITNISANPVWDLGSPLLCNDKTLVGLSTYKHPDMHHQRWPVVYSNAIDLFDWVKGIPNGNPRVVKNPEEECKGFWEPEAPQKPEFEASQTPEPEAPKKLEPEIPQYLEPEAPQKLETGAPKKQDTTLEPDASRNPDGSKDPNAHTEL
eukprot:evm.model.scf_3529.1 EVM.evm.TU.scf_3529.1   scf_3529:1217-2541(+)